MKVNSIVLKSFLTLFFFVGLSWSSYSVEVCDWPDDDITLKEGDSSNNSSGNRSLPIPIHVSFNYPSSSVNASFLSDIGIVAVTIENSDTAEYHSYLVDSSLGGDSFLISGDPGHYTITFTLANGTEYIGEWDL